METQHNASAATAAIATAIGTVTITGLAEHLNACDRTVHRWDRAGLIPRPLKLGHRLLRWSVAEVAEWQRAGCPPRADWERQRAEAATAHHGRGR